MFEAKVTHTSFIRRKRVVMNLEDIQLVPKSTIQRHVGSLDNVASDYRFSIRAEGSRVFGLSYCNKLEFA